METTIKYEMKVKELRLKPLYLHIFWIMLLLHRFGFSSCIIWLIKKKPKPIKPSKTFYCFASSWLVCEMERFRLLMAHLFWRADCVYHCFKGVRCYWPTCRVENYLHCRRVERKLSTALWLYSCMLLGSGKQKSMAAALLLWWRFINHRSSVEHRADPQRELYKCLLKIYCVGL